MGFDLSGLKPKNEKGTYFRNNCWYWRPLWEYCLLVKAITKTIAAKGIYNDGNVITQKQAEKIAKVLKEEVKSKRTEKYSVEYRKRLMDLPLVKCDICNGTGKRDDSIVKGECNGCQGKGKVKHFDTNYPFSVGNVKEFAEFCENSGGFTIW